MQTGNPMEPEMQKWNIPTERAWRADEKNGAIFLVIMFTPRGMVFTMSKMAHFLYLLMTTAKDSHSLGKRSNYTWKIFLSSFRNWYD